MSDLKLPLAERIRKGELLLGTVISIQSAEMTEVLALSGFDWLFIDAEHGGFAPNDALPLLQAAGTCPCLIRVPAHDEVWLKKALDIGPAGIVVPQVNSADEAQKIIDLCRYPPAGTRGMGVSRASQYGLNLGDYIKTANTNTAIVLQAEHKDAAANIEDIVKVEGIDAILVGPFDMSASFGKPGQVADPEVVAAIDTVTQTCQKAGLALGTAVAGADDARTYIEKGYSLVSAGVDSLHLINSAKQTLAGMRSN
ncbi:MAG: 2,4-dihydroxyhept-2-ene-1,7-dioic acid aldolase [Gammaproteobacteria bacterium]|mgnify:CR=1 FL=1|jgi:2-dehydro-3-deoxyglucarate aldolase|nr:2,4-dihydroxyhept-2-ene-1,7-dioic acid aldolase [Gammaproteobacteria bacterium]